MMEQTLNCWIKIVKGLTTMRTTLIFMKLYVVYSLTLSTECRYKPGDDKKKMTRSLKNKTIHNKHKNSKETTK